MTSDAPRRPKTLSQPLGTSGTKRDKAGQSGTKPGQNTLNHMISNAETLFVPDFLSQGWDKAGQVGQNSSKGLKANVKTLFYPLGQNQKNGPVGRTEPPLGGVLYAQKRLNRQICGARKAEMTGREAAQ